MTPSIITIMYTDANSFLLFLCGLVFIIISAILCVYMTLEFIRANISFSFSCIVPYILCIFLILIGVGLIYKSTKVNNIVTYKENSTIVSPTNTLTETYDIINKNQMIWKVRLQEK